MDKNKRRTIKEISEKAIELDWNKAFGGKSKGNRHLYRVNQIAQYIQTKEGGDLFVVLVGAWIHDVSLAYGNDDDPDKIAKHTQHFLEDFDDEITDVEIKQILNSVIYHEKGGRRLSLEAEIIHDADVIDKSGVLGVIRQVWKMTNLIDNKVLQSKSDLDRLKKHLTTRQRNTYTNTGRRLLELMTSSQNDFFSDEKLAHEMIHEISILAHMGRTSDNIAKELIALDNPVFSKLQEQLDCAYLESSTQLKNK